MIGWIGIAGAAVCFGMLGGLIERERERRERRAEADFPDPGAYEHHHVSIVPDEPNWAQAGHIIVTQVDADGDFDWEAAENCYGLLPEESEENAPYLLPDHGA